MVRVLKPWSTNLAKHQVKSPKVYIRDSGLLHRLLDIGSFPLAKNIRALAAGRLLEDL